MKKALIIAVVAVGLLMFLYWVAPPGDGLSTCPHYFVDQKWSDPVTSPTAVMQFKRCSICGEVVESKVISNIWNE